MNMSKILEAYKKEAVLTEADVQQLVQAAELLGCRESSQNFIYGYISREAKQNNLAQDYFQSALDKTGSF